MSDNKGLLLVISGPSGAGKSTVISRMRALRDDTVFSVSVTTRAPRPGETDGVDYFFISRERYDAMVSQDALLEHAVYAGNGYGTPAAFVDEQIAAGRVVILDIEVQGAAAVMAARRDAVTVFLCPPSLEELERRLRGRGTDSEEKILDRLSIARTEYRRIPHYQHLVINDDPDRAARELDAVVTAALCRTELQLHRIMEGELTL